MMRMQTLAKIMFVALGLYACLRLFTLVLGTIFALVGAGGSDVTLWGVLVLLIQLAGMGLVVKLLILNSQQWAQRLVQVEPEGLEAPPMAWLTVAFRLVCVGVGIYYLVTLIWSLGNSLTWIHHRSLMMSADHSLGTMRLFWQRSLKDLLCLPLCIYLLYGAPHFVRWQVSKVKQLCQRDH